jgi:carbon storage regulator
VCLVLSRRIDEAIIIGDSVRIEIVDVCGGRVRLAIEAPRNVEVNRWEVWCAKRAAKEAEAASALRKPRYSDPSNSAVPTPASDAQGTETPPTRPTLWQHTTLRPGELAYCSR